MVGTAGSAPRSTPPPGVFNRTGSCLNESRLSAGLGARKQQQKVSPWSPQHTRPCSAVWWPSNAPAEGCTQQETSGPAAEGCRPAQTSGSRAERQGLGRVEAAGARVTRNTCWDRHLPRPAHQTGLGDAQTLNCFCIALGHAVCGPGACVRQPTFHVLCALLLLSCCRS
jgi:hypothetical protein